MDGDRRALEQVLVNVLINAGQSLRGGGRTTVEGHVDGGCCVVTVRDTGVGIAPECLDRIGEPFFSSKADGTGIGLAIARRILKSHAGRLTIESELGVGTTVEISIPLSQLAPTNGRGSHRIRSQ